MEVKAVFLDVDGTLVSFETHCVPQSAIDALHQIHRSGIKIIIATGRSSADLHELSEIPYDGIVALNGADCVLCDGTVIARNVISLDDFQRIEYLARQYDFPLALESNRGIFVNKLTPAVNELSALVHHPLPVVANLEKLFQEEECCQICLYCEERIELEVMKQLPGLTSSRWNPLLADINVDGVDKAWGMRAFCAHFGFEMSQTMAFGDGGNDIAMLQAAGIGVAMGGSSKAVKDAAHYVTQSVEDAGLQHALVHFGVIENRMI